MSVVSKAELVKKGVEALDDAERAMSTAEFRDAELSIGMANAYARLAEALGEKRISIRRGAVGNW